MVSRGESVAWSKHWAIEASWNAGERDVGLAVPR